MTKQNKSGFTLIELLFTLVIIGILTAIGLPSYFQYVMRAHRIEGINTLNSIQLAQEKYRGNNASYGTLAAVWGGVTVSVPNSYYALAITNPTATGYTATATAQGTQAGDTQNGTSCQVLTLTINGLTTTQTPAACWSR